MKFSTGSCITVEDFTELASSADRNYLCPHTVKIRISSILECSTGTVSYGGTSTVQYLLDAF